MSDDARIEGLVLGALLDAEGPVLRSNAPALLGACRLEAGHFATPWLRAGFRSVAALADLGRRADSLAVYLHAKATGKTEESLLAALQGLQASNGLDHAGFLEHADEMRRRANLRALRAFCAATAATADAPGADPAKLIQHLEAFAQRFAGAAGVDETAEADLLELASDWEAAVSGARPALVPTGIRALDEVIGGLPQNLTVIGGMPSVGKSALTAEILSNCLSGGMRVGLFGLEDATKWVAKRLLARRVGLSVRDVGSGRLNGFQQERLQVEFNDLAPLLRNLTVYRRAGISAPDLVARAKHWVLNLGVRLVVIDHGGEVQHEGGGRERNDLAVAATYRQLRDLAVNHRVPVVVLSHFNRDVDKQLGGKPRLSSFAETEYIARMARLALGLWERPGEADHLRVTVLKQTEGERGVTVRLKRDMRAALVNSSEGEVVDLDAEAREDAERERRAQKERRSSSMPAADWRERA